MNRYTLVIGLPDESTFRMYGFITMPAATTIGAVTTGIAFTFSSALGTVADLNFMTRAVAPNDFQPVNVAAGQIVQVTVLINFS